MAQTTSYHIVRDIFHRCQPDRVALIYKDQSITYSQLATEVEKLTLALKNFIYLLQAENPTAKLRIGLYYPSGAEYIPIALSILQSDACFVPIPDELTDLEKNQLIDRTQLHGLLIATSFTEWIKTNPKTICIQELNPSLSNVIFSPPQPQDFNEVDFASVNPAFIRFSSGTTGNSKGVVISHQTLLERILCANQGLKIDSSDRVMWVLPMAHHFAVSIILYLYHGATTLIAESEQGDALVDLMSHHRASIMYGSPVHYRQLLASPKHKLESLQTHLQRAIVTASAMDEPSANTFMELTQVPLHQGLGIIEVGLPLLNTAHPHEFPLSIGAPQPGIEARLRPIHDHEEIPNSVQQGELLLRGQGFFDAYLSPWCLRSQVFDAEGWFATGDIAELIPTTSIYRLCGRLKSVLNIGGMKVFPEEVESYINLMDDIKQSLVHSKSNPVYGEIPVAKILMQPGANFNKKALITHLRRYLSAYKIPILFEVVDQLPLTASGKLKRH
jgi:long-chain acyl-CoA synthetase